MKKILLLSMFIVSLFPDLLTGKTIIVDINNSGDFNTIQTGIDSAVTGDTVLVMPGTYIENINFLGKHICVMSSAGPELTIIDGSQPEDVNKASAVSFVSREDSTSIIKGFTITGGTGSWIPDYGGQFVGGGIFCYNSSPVIEGNIIRDNITRFGGGISLFNSNAIVRRNVIWRNAAYDPLYCSGGGIDVVSQSKPLIINNTIVGNSSPDIGAGLAVEMSISYPILINNIVANNNGDNIYAGENVQVKIRFSNVWPSSYVNVN